MPNVKLTKQAWQFFTEGKLSISAFMYLSMIASMSCQYIPLVNSNNIQRLQTQSSDNFKKELCRERWHRIDWHSMLRPCIYRTAFGQNLYPSTLQTNAMLSKVTRFDIRKAGEYSTLIIQTVDQVGALKSIGGDTWRIMITGPSSLQPLVHDLNNGQYEIPFLIMEPGLYKADVFMEGTLCNQYFDPPTDWFKMGEFFSYQNIPKLFKPPGHFGKVLC